MDYRITNHLIFLNKTQKERVHIQVNKQDKKKHKNYEKTKSSENQWNIILEGASKNKVWKRDLFVSYDENWMRQAEVVMDLSRHNKSPFFYYGKNWFGKHFAIWTSSGNVSQRQFLVPNLSKAHLLPRFDRINFP